MKNLIVLMTAMALALGLTACGNSDADARAKFYNTPTPAKSGL